MKINWRNFCDKTDEVIKLSFKKYSLFLLRLTPHQNIAQTVLAYTLLGTIVLCLPFMTTTHVSILDNLFTSAAAVSTSGLNTVNFADSYTFLGKLVVLLLIQIGGVGYMTFASFIFLSLSQRHHLRPHQQEALSTEVSLPNTLKMSDFLWSAVAFTTLAESIGAVVLYNYFRGQDFTVFNAIWYSIFHSVSAFCTAGFSLWNNSLENFADSRTINTVLCCLALAGSMGFIVIADLANFIRRKTKEISLTTKLIVISTLALLCLGTVTLLMTSPSLTITEALFQSIAAMTTCGFSTVNVSLLSSASLLVLILLMCIGGAPAGTAGGIKMTAFCTVVAIMHARLQLRSRVSILGRRIPSLRLYAATSTFLLYTLFLFISVFMLTWTEKLPFLSLVMESAAALSTGGLSTGISGELSFLGKLIIIGTMIVGRIGVITFGTAVLSSDEDDDKTVKPISTEDVAV